MKRKRLIMSFMLTILFSLTITLTPGTEALAYGEVIEVYDGDRLVLEYIVLNGEAEILRSYSYEDGDLEYQIPAYIGGYKVTTIGESAFYDTLYEKIIIPDTVKTIRAFAFSGDNAALKELTIPDSVTTLEELAFGYRSNIEKIVIGNGLKEIPEGLFKSNSTLKSVTLGDNVEVIGRKAFYECSSLENVTLGNNLKTIGMGAFEYCSSLKSVIIPSRVENIEDSAFSQCTSLQSITIPDGVTSIGEFVFYGCSSLKRATIGNGLKNVPLGTFQNNESLTNVIFGKNVEEIGGQAFLDCISLKEVNFPDKLKSIGRMAFWGCTSIENLTMPSSMQSIGEGAFYECTALKNLSLNYGLTEIGEEAFGETISLSQVTIPGSVNTIEFGAFIRSGVEGVILGDGVERIEREAFSQCYNLKSINISDSVTHIGSYAFSSNSALETLVIGDGVEEIGAESFGGCTALKSVSFGGGVKTIQSRAFVGCSALENVKLNEGLEIIGISAFSGCIALEEITIPETVMEISSSAFFYCTALKSVNIPNYVTEISNSIFANCSALENISLGYSVKTIGEYAFKGCKNLKELYIPVSLERFLNSNCIEESGIKDIIYGGTQSQWEKIKYRQFIDNKVTVHFGRKTENASTVTTKTDSVYLYKTIAYKNLNDMNNPTDNYVICTDAVVTIDGKEYMSDNNGIIPLSLSYGEITVSAPGYITETLSYEEYMSGIGVYLEKETNLPVIKSVKLGKGEIRRAGLTFFKSKSDRFKAIVDFNGHTNCEVYIENGDNIWPIYSNGYSDNIDIGKSYNRWNNSRIVVKMPDGQVIYKWLDLGYAPEAIENPQVVFDTDFTNLGQNALPYLDKIKFDFSIPNFPFEITIEGDKVVATMGVDLATWKYSGEKGEWDNEYNAHKTLSEVIKNTYEQMEEKESIAEQYSNLLKDVGSAKQKGLKSKLGFDASLSAMGFLEGTITDKGIEFTDSGIIIALEAEGGLSDTGIVMVGTAPVPYNWEALLKGSIEAKLHLMQNDEHSGEMAPMGTIEIDMGFKVDGGPGIPDAHVNFGVDGSLNPLFTFTQYSNDFKLDADIGVFMEAAIGPFEHTFYLNKTVFHLYPKPKEKLAKIRSFSAADFELINRDNLEGVSTFVANDGISLFAESKVLETVLKTNTFKVSDPQMADMGMGKRIVVWVDDDFNADAINGRTIMYSYFDGSVWSDEQYVDRNGMSAFNPQIKMVGNRVYLAWQSVDEALSKVSTFDDMLKNTEIKYAVFNDSTGRFENITSLTDNNYIDTNPVINDVNGTPVITWVGNSSNDIFTANKNNSISFAVVDGETVIRTETAAEGLSSVDSHIATGSMSMVDIMYIADTDDNHETIDDNELFSTYYGQITDDDNVKSGIQSVDGSVYFYNGGKLACYYNGVQNDVGVNLPHDRFVICEDSKTVVYLQRDGATSDVYAYFYEDTVGKYGKSVRLTDMSGYYLEDISCFENSEGMLVLAFNKRHITGDFEENIDALYGQSDLSTAVITPFYDITLDFAYADVNNIMPGYDTVIEADITNNGSKTVNYVNITLCDEFGDIIVSGDEIIKLLPGESGTVKLVYSVPQDFIGFDGEVIVSLEEEREINDNSYGISLVCRDISVDNLKYAANEDGTYTIYSEVANLSLTEETEVKITLMNNNIVVDEKVIDSLDKMERTILAFENVLPGYTYSVVAQQLENETMLGNNDEFITIAVEDDGYKYVIEGLNLKTIGEEISIEADVVADEAMTEDALLIVALYNKRGALVSSKALPAKFNNESIKSVKGSMDVCDYDSVKVMLWNTSLKPLAEAVN